MGSSPITGHLYLKDVFDSIMSHQGLTYLTDNPVSKEKGHVKGYEILVLQNIFEEKAKQQHT